MVADVLSIFFQEYFDSVTPSSLEVVETGLIHRQGFSAAIDSIQKLLGDWSLFKVHPIFNFSKIAGNCSFECVTESIIQKSS